MYASYQSNSVKLSLIGQSSFLKPIESLFIEKSSINLDFSKNFPKQLSFSSKMADNDHADREHEIESSDSGSDFGGFDEEEIDIRRGGVIRNVEMNNDNYLPQNDPELPIDLENGWGKIDSPPINAPFTKDVLLNTQMDSTEPIDFFKLFFDDDIVELLVTQTNLYAEQCTAAAGNITANSRLSKWKVIDTHEMKVFMSLVICMGLAEKRDLKEYWSTDFVVDTPFFKKYMCRDRFQSILANFHITDNSKAVARGEPGFDPLYKLRPIVTKLNSFSDIYKPEKDLSFDEATCGWKGKLRFRVYNPAKPTRFGIKLYQVCEASTGYCIGFDIYTGDPTLSCTTYCEALGLDDNLNTTTKVVVGLLSKCGLLETGHHVYMDNYYTSPELFEELYLLNMYACGTLRKNRKQVPKAIQVKTRINIKQCIFRRREHLLCLRYLDKRDVYMLSTIHPATVSVLDKRDRTTGMAITKPTCIVEYCKKMGGVDLSDQIGSYFSCLRKTTKWYKKLFFHLLNVMVINSYILYKKYGPADKKLDHLAFRRAVCQSLIDESPLSPRPSLSGRKAAVQDVPERLKERHFPDYILAGPGAKRARPMRDCVGCNPIKSRRAGKKRKQTSYWCPDCQKPLSVPECFRVYHTLQNYRQALVPDADNGDNAE